MNNQGDIIDLDKLQNNSFIAADFLKTLANSNRLVILSQLLDKEMCVGDLEKNLDISQSALSQHLGRMRAEGLVETRRESQQIFYRLKDYRVAHMLKLTYDLFCHEELAEAV
ncbi:MAG: metalloregulator ArsR/SmtB family transcription factor [Emcibacter sp.]|nr:metalloregulator ArsR/SmtB family transcription factor [Emcibacter sp.]